MNVTDGHRDELERIRLRNNGFLRPGDVVDEARKKSSPLHECFPWDDKEAAHIGRCEIARQIIRRVMVTVTHGDSKPIKVRAYVALQEDRGGGSYTSVLVAMETEGGRAALLKEAMSELSSFRKKYSDVRELCSLFDEVDKLLAA